MKRKTVRIAAMTALLPFALITPVLAHEGHEEGAHPTLEAVTTVSESTTEPTETETESSTQKRERIRSQVNKSELEARLAEKKQALTERLSAAESARLKNRCSAAQGKLASLHGRINGIETSRREVHTTIVERLEKVVTTLNGSGVDVADLTAHVAEVQQLIQDFDDALESYKLAVSDVVAMECEADPKAFKAALKAARESQTEVREASRAVHDFVKETIKPTLATIRSELEAKTGEENEDATE